MKKLLSKLFFLLLTVAVFGGAIFLPKIVQKSGSVPQPLGESAAPEQAPESEVSPELLQAARELQSVWQGQENVQTTSSGTTVALDQTSEFFKALALRDFDAADAEVEQLKSSELSEELTSSLETALSTARAEKKQLDQLTAALESSKAIIVPPAPEELPPLPKGGTIHFEHDSSVVPAEGLKLLARITKEAQVSNSFLIQVRGFADKSGASEYNAILAKARAEAVRDALVESGASSSQVKTLSFGESQSSTTEEEVDETSRRVEIIFRYRENYALSTQG